MACERLGVVYDDAEHALMMALWARYQHLERPLRIFVTLRELLSRPIERLLLLDRLLFLREAGLQGATIHEIFNPATSPRSTAIVASSSDIANGCCLPCE